MIEVSHLPLNHYQFIGTCISTVDEELWDATEMAQLIENSAPFDDVPSILSSIHDDLREHVIVSQNERFSFGVYDDTDVHYFYELLK